VFFLGRDALEEVADPGVDTAGAAAGSVVDVAVLVDGVCREQEPLAESTETGGLLLSAIATVTRTWEKGQGA